MNCRSLVIKCILISCFAIPAYAFAKRQNPADTNYIKSYKNTLCISLPVTAKSFFLRFQDHVNLTKLLYMPSPAASVGIDFDTRLLSLSISPGFFNIKANPGRYGKSEYQDIQLNLYPSFLTIDLNLQSYNGFFLQNSRKFSEYDRKDPYKRPDMTAISGGMQVLYSFNRKHFSFSSPFSYCSTQLKSAGSFIAGGGFSAFILSNDSGIVGMNIKNQFTSDINYTDVTAVCYNLNAGYGYTFVIKKNFFVAAYVIPGIGITNLRNTRLDSSTYRLTNTLGYNVNYRLALGYDNKKWYAGTYCILHDYYFNQTGDSETDYSNLKFKIYAGCRFDFSRLKQRVLTSLKRNKSS